MSGLSCSLLPTTSNKMLIKFRRGAVSGTVSDSKRSLYLSLIVFLAACNDEHNAVAVVLLDDYAPSFQLVARIDFHATAGPVNVVFAHVASEYALSRFLRCNGDTAVSPVPMQYKRLPPGSSSSILPKSLRPACLRLAPPSAATIERSVPQVKHVDDEASLCSDLPPLPPPPALQRSAAQIKHVDDEVLIFVHEQSAADPTHRRGDYNVSTSSPPPSPHPPFLLLAAYERSVPLIKRVNDEANVSQSNRPAFGCPLLPLLPALQRSAGQIKHVDDEVNTADQACRRQGWDTTMKSKRWTTSNRVRMSVLSSSLSLTTSTASISQIRRARLVREKQQEEARANTRSMRARLAEACMEIGDTDDLDCGSNGGLDYSDGDRGTIGLPPLDEDNDDELDDELDDAHPVYSKYFQPFMHSQPRSHRRHDTRPRAQRNRHAHQAWQAQLPTLVDRYLAWKHNGPEELAGDHVFHVDVIGVFRCSSTDSLEYERHVNVIQKADESANAALLRVGLLGCSPSQPRIAIRLECLELYHQIRRRQSSFSLQAMMKVLCALQNITYSHHLRAQLSAAFDVYLNILRSVHTLLKQALGRDGPAWKLRGACPACAFERLDGSGSADSRLFHSDYFIPHAEVERFKDEVRDRPGEAAREKRFTTCTDNWTAAKAIEENQIQVFEQTGIFVMACRHWLRRVYRGNETKWRTALTSLIARSMDWRLLVGCSTFVGKTKLLGMMWAVQSKKTIASSSLGNEVQEKWLKVVVNAFHGFAHNHLCQLENHPLYQAPLIRHASEFHWKQFLDLHFSQWDSDKYLELSRFLYNNYKQALYIIQTHLAELERFKRSKDITDDDFESWHREELEYLKRCAGESDATSIATQYVELLEKLNFAEATYGSVTQVPYLTYTPAEFTSTAGLNESARQGTNAINAEYASALRKYQLQLNVVANFERQHNITDRWTPLHREYINAREYTKHRAFIRAVEELEGLVVQRMFELSKANLAKTGYKMRKHISKAISRRSAAIRAALERYNKLAPRQRPPRPKLDYAEVIGYSLLGEFSLLKHSHYEILEKPWALPDNREMMMKYYKLQRSQEEITRLNVEIRRLQAWLDFDGERMKVAAQGFRDSGSSELAFEMESMYAERVRVNDFHRAQLQKIYEMPGYTGCRPIGYQPRVTGDGTGDEYEEDDS
ncbi:hypothetical protein EV401DRAFT_1895465 [Pisolithus croceorrhizus]|nr:hypothetical protein EV401DRAFT_1895465 [Pisolithus croceorrhizus]